MIESLEQSQKSQFNQSTAHTKLTKDVAPNWGDVPPEDYVVTYGRLDTVNNETFLKKAFTNGASSHSAPLISRSSVVLYPKVFSFDPRTLAFQRALVERLNSELPPDTDGEGFSKTGIHTTFDRIKCPAGYFMNPMSYTAVDNERYRVNELGLRAGMSDEDKLIANEVWELVWSEAVVRPVNVAKLSTSGMRRFTHDVQWKLAFAEWLFVEENFEAMLNAVDKSDAITLANDFETVYGMYIQKRGQVDAPGKIRKVIDLQYALTSGRKGREFASDKSVIIDGVRYDDFSAVRARVVQAGPWTVNCFLQVCATTAMYSLFDRFPSTFHINTPEQIKEITEGKYIFCSDVTEYDRSMHIDDIRMQHSVMEKYWDPRIVKASWRLYTAPYYSKPLSVDGKGGVWVGDPADWSSELHSGNRSGHACTSLTAKVQKVIDTLIVINKMYPVVGRCRTFLEGKGPMGFVNNGDDEIVWFRSRHDHDRFKVLRADRKLGRYAVEPEVGQGFSGQLLTRESRTSLSYTPKAKIHTTFEKLWVPERSIGGLHRKYWTIGVIDRISNITKTEEGRHAWEIHNSIYRSMMAPHFGDFTATLMSEHSRIELDMNGLTSKDRELLEDPAKIHYKFSSEEISAPVLAAVTSKIPPPVVESMLNRYYTGHIK